MKIVIFGLTVTSSWGNAHAVLWRALCAALARRGHHAIFFERDAPCYAAHRELDHLPGNRLELYPTWHDGHGRARHELATADVAIVTSFCPDALAAAELAAESPALRLFYDLDAPLTLETLRAGRPLPHVGTEGYSKYDLVLSSAGGPTLEMLRSQLGAGQVAALPACADSELHRPLALDPAWRADVTHLGAFGADLRAPLEELLVAPARRRSTKGFVLGGALYPAHPDWPPNLMLLPHIEPERHAALFASSRLVLSLAGATAQAAGHCPPLGIFAAAACGAPIVSDAWEGLTEFFTPGTEVLVAKDTADVLAALERSDEELGALGRAARERFLAEHTADHRVEQLERLLLAAHAARSAPSGAGESAGLLTATQLQGTR